MRTTTSMTAAAGLVSALIWSAASADPRTMRQQEFTDLLAGNTMHGEWAGTEYKQYFYAGGRTDYQEKGQGITRGTWRIKADGSYCSVWPPSPAEACYTVKRDGGTLLWYTDDLDVYYPATVLPGRQMEW